jgi:hypothetical protein
MDLEAAERFKQQYMPSSNVSLLSSLIGLSIDDIVRYSWWPADDTTGRLHVTADMVFSLTLGPFMVQLNDGRVIGVGDNPPLKSVTIWLERDANGLEMHLGDVSDKFPVLASDTRFASKTIRSVLGNKIIRVRILKRRSNQTFRPCEAGLLFEFENSCSLLFAHGLYDDMNSFSAITPDQIMEEIRPELYELEVIEAQRN